MDETATINLVIHHPFNKALKTVRRVLIEAKLVISAEVDLTARIQQSLGIELQPCTMLCVDAPMLLLQTIAIDQSAALLVSVRVVVAGHQNQTTVHLLDTKASMGSRNSITQAAAIEIQNLVSHALETVASREAAGVLVAEVANSTDERLRN